METHKKVYSNIRVLAETLAKEILIQIEQSYQTGNPFYIMLSGGSTPKALFEALARLSGKNTQWDHVHLFWGDERCVAPIHPESNFGMTRQTLLNQISIPQNNVHRIQGENDPELEVKRYTQQLLQIKTDTDQIPLFDLILLGMGDDGHTASIFPDRLDILQSEELCEIAINPYSGQKRITITPKVINNAKKILFLVTGENKADILTEIFEKTNGHLRYPASHIAPKHGKLLWLLDSAANKGNMQ